jgi:SOS-response transcriptional repressor LexA
MTTDRRRIAAKPLTRRQRLILAFCDRFLTQNDQLPTHQALMDHFGWSSPNSAHEAFVSLERRGLLERNALGRLRFTDQGRSLIPECNATALEESDRRYVLADKRCSA